MQDNKEILTDMPIAGESLTAELGSRPWQSPPQFRTPEEAIGHYFTRLTDPEDSAGVINALEMGVPVETLTEVIQLGGVMEGLHTIDVGVLISPVIAETIIQLAEKSGIKYTVEDKENPEEKMPEDIDVRLATMDLEPSVKSVDEIMTGKEEPVDEVKEEEPKGLMARRVQDGV
tara:strand:+ start:53 stop:574 length:522 start_codon:yes stop_codon:yes gene_type:complete